MRSYGRLSSGFGDASGHSVTLTSDASPTYPLGVTLVTWTATDESGNKATATQKVTVVDQEKPRIASLPAIQKFCEPGKLGTRVELPKPTATDNTPGAVVVTSAVGTQFPIGTTSVVWTATDAAGNQATMTQNVVVINRKPRSNAGENVTITTTSEKGAKVTMDGSRSSDPDKHKLKYRWTAPGVKLSKGTTAKPSGDFPIGTKTAKLTVTDAGGLKHVDTVKLNNAKRRPRGRDADRSFAAAAEQARRAVSPPASGGSALPGFAYADAAAAYGDAAGEYVRWHGQSKADAALAYAEARSTQ